MGNSGLIKGLSPNEIAIEAKKSFDQYLSSIKMSTGKSSTLEDYLNMLKLLAEAKFWAIKYFLVETSVSERFRMLPLDLKQDFQQEFIDDVAEGIRNGSDLGLVVMNVLNNYPAQ